MSRALVSEDVASYVENTITRETEAQKKLRVETAAMPRAGMQIGRDQAAFMSILARSIGAKKAIEVGTFTGFSALAVASALPADGKLIACDISEEWTSVARRHWQAAGVAAKIDLRIAPAEETLRGLLRDGGRGTFDLAFIDADKGAYDVYYELCLELLRPNGLVLLDNMLWSGQVVRPSDDADTRALQALNLKIRDDERVEPCLLTVGDGLVIARKR